MDTKAHPFAKYIVEDYEPHFDRLSTERRVLGHITPEVDREDLGPRNTLSALEAGLRADPHTDLTDDVASYLDDLVEAGLAERDDDGVYAVTEAGWTELVN